MVRTALRPDGGVLYIIGQPAATLPPVTKRDIEQAWDAAQTGGGAATPRIFQFVQPGREPVELLLTDQDAAAWAGAVDQAADLSTPHGVSVCLRLLALVELMGRATWLRPWFSLHRGGAELHPALLQAAALAPLNDAGGFDETALGVLLPRA